MLTLLLLYALLLAAWAAFPLREGIAFIGRLMADEAESGDARINR
jgi:hypothetical protein